MKLKDFLEKQLASGKLTWNSKSELIRASGNNISGYNNKILEEYKSKFKFGSSLEIKNNEIKKYFNSLQEGSFVNVTGAVIKIQEQLPKNISISETVIYNRLADKNFNVKKLKLLFTRTHRKSSKSFIELYKKKCINNSQINLLF